MDWLQHKAIFPPPVYFVRLSTAQLEKVCMQHAFLQRPDIPVRLQNEVLLRLLPMDFCTAEDALHHVFEE